MVTGTEFSGMSQIVVIPPASAAAVADAKPSQSVRPGSLTWTCESTSPGSRATSPRSTSAAAPGRAPYSAMDSMVPFRTNTLAAATPPGSATFLDRMTRSGVTRPLIAMTGS